MYYQAVSIFMKLLSFNENERLRTAAYTITVLIFNYSEIMNYAFILIILCVVLKIKSNNNV